MSLFHTAAGAFKRLMLGRHDIPQQCVLGLRDPQEEIAVELHGLGVPRDVTHQHTLASAVPFSVCLRLESDLEDIAVRAKNLSLRFSEKSGSQRLLGEFALRPRAILPIDDHKGYCFTVSKCKNYCLPQARLLAHYFHGAYARWRRPPDLHMSSRDIRAMPIFFICPRPVGLISVGGLAGNLFPVNLMGPLGDSTFGFALNSSRQSMALLKRARKFALSSVPLEQASVVRGMGGNHKRGSIDWQELPFGIMRSKRLGLPVPCFSLRVREMEVITSQDMGSHTLFIARILEDQHYMHGPQFFMIHGMYQAYRQHLEPQLAHPSCHIA
jgi:flavin reductase (DIM6/NTAB) family NADH-FMN oxidoreductase RutF